MTDWLSGTGVGATPVPDDWLADLIPTWVATMEDLYRAEEDNIAAATASIRTPRLEVVLDDAWLRRLHRAMFRDVWKWAGKRRNLEMSIGIDPALIPSELRELVNNTRFWVDEQVFPPEEVAVRFHHRIVQVHPFTNGNGRHGRIATDYLLGAMGEAPFTWGASLGVDTDALRAAYVGALVAMDRDRDDVQGLLSFARS